MARKLASLTIKSEAGCGTNLGECALEAWRVASLLLVNVEFVFNGFTMTVAPTDTPEDVIRTYERWLKEAQEVKVG